MKCYLTILFGVCAAMFSGTALSQSQSSFSRSFYQNADGMKKDDLKAALTSLIQIPQEKKFKYKDLWQGYEQVDYMDETNDYGQHRVFDYYSDEVYYFNGNGDAVGGMNKEHVAPQSWWVGGTSINVGSDLLQVLPSDASANNSKSNYCLGIPQSNIKIVNKRLKTGRNQNGDFVWEPCDEYKGDFARIYFYVATAYPDVPWETSVSGTEVAFKKESYPTLKAEFQNLLLQWHRQDPVCEWEITRNARVYIVQGNRNPFIDYPQLAEYIWGDSINTVWDLATAVPNGVLPEIPVDTIPTDTIPTDTIPTDTIPTDTIPTDTIVVDSLILELAYAESFEDITKGDNITTGGSSNAWTGNDSVPTVNSCYQANGAVRIGTSKKNGSITTCSIHANAGDTLRVSISVKGWTSVEGDLEVSLTNTPTQTISYTAKMSDDFETVELTFFNIPTANPQLTIETTSHRCFIGDIRVYRVHPVPAVTPEIHDDPEIPTEEEKEKQRLLELCDLDEDGKITISDITQLINMYLEATP